ncbi:MAG: biotin-dependent carboxyltransferase family protein [Woeseiaceae bacterium]
MRITVLKPGLQTTLQSRPRIGLRHLGVPASGAADPLSLALANRLVANTWDAVALEVTLLGPTLRMNTDCAIAVVGASFDVMLNNVAMPLHETVFAAAGDVLSVGGCAKGARCYIAFSGGLGATEVLGSSSTYLTGELGGLQGRALQPGDELRVSPARVPGLSTPAGFRIPMSTSWALRVCESFETDRLTGESRERLFESNWTVGRRSDRMGLKLDGARLDILSDGRMPSAAVFPGTVQCPENGAPFILSVDAGTVGGYPRVAQVVRADRHLLGQLKPGDHVRLLHRDMEVATRELRDKHDYWRGWITAIEQVI